MISSRIGILGFVLVTFISCQHELYTVNDNLAYRVEFPIGYETISLDANIDTLTFVLNKSMLVDTLRFRYRREKNLIYLDKRGVELVKSLKWIEIKKKALVLVYRDDFGFNRVRFDSVTWSE